MTRSGSHAALWFVAATVVSGYSVGPAHAEDAAADSKEYTQTIEQAVEQFRAREFTRARELFEAAHERQPSARTLRGLGLTDFESGRYALAVSELEASLKDPRKPLDPQQRSEVQAVIAHARGFVGTLELQVTPRDAAIRVDGQPANGDSLQLDAGTHVVRASAAGYIEAEQEVRVIPADVTNAIFALVPVESDAPAETSNSDSTQLTAAWIIGAVGAAGVIAGSIFGVRSILKHNESDRYCGKDGLCSDNRGVTAMEDARTAGDISTVAFVVGGIALGVGTVLFVTAPSSEAESKESARAPRLQIGPGAVRLSGAF